MIKVRVGSLTTTVTTSNQPCWGHSLLHTILSPFRLCPPRLPHLLISSTERKRQGKSQRSDPPGGKRWRRSTCSLSVHCPLQLQAPWKQIRRLICNSSFLLALLVRIIPSQRLPESPSIQQCKDQWNHALCIATGQPHIHHLQWVIKFSSTTQTNQAKLITKSLYRFLTFFLFLSTTRKSLSQSHSNPSLALHLMCDHGLFDVMQ